MSVADLTAQLEPIPSLLQELSNEIADLPIERKERIEATLQKIRASAQTPIPKDGQPSASRREVAELLTASETRYQALLDCITDPCTIYDADLRMVYRNEASKQAVQVPDEQAIGKTFGEIYPHLMGTEIHQAYLRALQMHQPQKHLSYWVRPSDGQEFYWDLFIYPNHSGLIAFSKDATERIRTKMALLKSEEKFAKAFRSTSNGLTITRLQDGKFIDVNDSYLRLVGYTREEVIGHTTLELGIIDLNEQERIVRYQQKHGSVRNFEFLIKRKTGQTRCVLTSFEPLEMDGEACVLTTFTDITEQKLSQDLDRASNEIQRIIHSSLDFSEIFNRSISVAGKALESDTAGLSLRKEGHWVVSGVFGLPEEMLGMEMDDNQERHAMLAIQTRQPVAVSDAFNDERFNREHLRKYGIRSVLVIPVIVKDEAIGAVFFNYQQTVFAFQQVHIDFAAQVASYLSSSLENAQLLHNLENEIAERKQAEQTLEKALNEVENEKNRLLAVMEALPIGLSIQNQMGGVSQYNKGFEAVWGGPIPSTPSVDEYGAYQAWWAETGQPVQPEEWASAQAVQKGETITGQFLQIQRFDGTRAFVMNTGAPIRDANGAITGCAVAIMDITPMIEAENALRESQERLRVALSGVPLMVYTCDRELRYTWIYQPLRGFRAEEVIGKRDDELLPAEAVAELMAVKQQALDTGQGGVHELMVSLHGENTYYLFTAEPDRDRNGNITGLTCSAIDITEQKRLEAEQQEQVIQLEVQRRLLDRREQDRAAIARDLHDGPIQSLSSTMFQLQILKEVFPDPALQTELKQFGTDIKRTIQELRDVLNELRPPTVIQFGFSRVAHLFVEDLRARFPDLEIEADIAEDDQLLSKDTHLTLFRIFQEGINNIIRHSDASKAWVVYKIEQGCFRLELRDNGKGFEVKKDLSHLVEHGHYGLVGIKERAEIIQAEFSVSSEPGKGTTMMVQGPCSGKNLK